MAEGNKEEKAGKVKETVQGWFKGLATSIVGLLSGAFLMYLTPIVNSTIKPARPFANFATQANGLTVTFNNHSTGSVDGWWDFGDGSELVPFAPKDATITHAYDKPGSYNVKLQVQNVIGEENDRTVAVNLDSSTAIAKPAIGRFEVTPIDKRERVPATYALKTEVKNAAYCILHLGDDRPLQLGSGGANPAPPYIVFEKAGTYTIRLAAVNGTDIVEQTKTVHVVENPGQRLVAKLSANVEAVKVEQEERRFHIPCTWQGGAKENVSPIHAERLVKQGFVIASAELVNKDDKTAPVRNLKLDIAPDKKSYLLTGELVKGTAWLQPRIAPRWLAEVKVVMERRSAPAMLDRGDVVMEANLNGTITLPMRAMDAGWIPVSSQVKVGLYEGRRKVWETAKAVTKAPVTLNNQTCYVTAVAQKDGMQLQIEGPTTAPVMPVSGSSSESPARVIPSASRQGPAPAPSPPPAPIPAFVPGPTVPSPAIGTKSVAPAPPPSFLPGPAVPAPVVGEKPLPPPPRPSFLPGKVVPSPEVKERFAPPPPPTGPIPFIPPPTVQDSQQFVPASPAEPSPVRRVNYERLPGLPRPAGN